MIWKLGWKYKQLAEGPGVARGKKNYFDFFSLQHAHPWVSTKKISPFGPAVWPAIGIIYIYECLVLFHRSILCLDDVQSELKSTQDCLEKLKSESEGGKLVILQEEKQQLLVSRYTQQADLSLQLLYWGYRNRYQWLISIF